MRCDIRAIDEQTLDQPGTENAGRQADAVDHHEFRILAGPARVAIRRREPPYAGQPVMVIDMHAQGFIATETFGR